MNNKVRNMVLYAMGISITILLTYFFSFPAIVHNGFVNLGDVSVLVCGALFGPIGGLVSGGVGSAVTDLLLGYSMYAPFTLVIKGLEGLLAGLLIKKLSNRHTFLAFILPAAVMVLGYFLAEIILYGVEGSIVNVPGNSLQGIVCATLAILLYGMLVRAGVKKQIKSWYIK